MAKINDKLLSKKNLADPRAACGDLPCGITSWGTRFMVLGRECQTYRGSIDGKGVLFCF